MAPYFETAKSFADVPITDDGVDTAAFLLASTDFVNMFDLLGGGVFAFVQNDLRSNITGVRHRFDAASAESPTLEKLVTNECSGGSGAGDRHGTACLVRLVRGLWFTCEALRVSGPILPSRACSASRHAGKTLSILRTRADMNHECARARVSRRTRGMGRDLWQNMQRDRNAELHTCFKRSYDANLKHHHSFVIRSVVSVAIRAVPHRREFYVRITQGGSHEKFDEELTKWLAGLERIVLRLRAFLEEGGYGRI